MFDILRINYKIWYIKPIEYMHLLVIYLAADIDRI